MALFEPERIPQMHCFQLRNRLLMLGVLGALLFSFVLSFAFAGTASAAPHSCVFQAVSSATFSTVGGSSHGALDPITAQITKYSDGCNQEFATMTISGFSYGFTSFSAGVLVEPVRIWSSVNSATYPTTSISTPIRVGNGLACGYISFTVYQGSGQGSGCTPS